MRTVCLGLGWRGGQVQNPRLNGLAGNIQHPPGHHTAVAWRGDSPVQDLCPAVANLSLNILQTAQSWDPCCHHPQIPLPQHHQTRRLSLQPQRGHQSPRL